jgi:hypothetical protein
MKVSYVGNFDPDWSTENHVATALENIGHEVQRIPEQRTEWAELPDLIEGDFLLWTRTAGFDPPDRELQRRALEAVKVPKVGFHLDRWFGLARESEERGPLGPDPSPFFTHMDLLCTADGGHQSQWATRHIWFPPAILGDEAEPGEVRDSYRFDVGFVGNLRGYGHAEWAPYREALWTHLRDWYRGRFQVFPFRGQPQLRGRNLANVYASVKVMIGDSCLPGETSYYWSDRIPETTGRGGFIIHPWVKGLEVHHPDVVTYPLGEFDILKACIDYALEDPEWRTENAQINRSHTIKYHLYEHRMQRLVTLIE